MTLKAALQADLAAKGLNLGDLAEKLGITQQSVSKWIAKDEIPKDRVDDVREIVGPNSHTMNFILLQAQRLVRGPIGGKGVPGAGPDDEEVTHISFAEQEAPRPAGLRRLFGNVYRPGQSRVERWAFKLDEKLRHNVLRVVEIHGGLRRFDYLSDRLALMVRPPPIADPAKLVQAIVPLLLLKARDPSLDCKLVLLPYEEMDLPVPVVERNEASRIHGDARHQSPGRQRDIVWLNNQRGQPSEHTHR